MGVLEQLENINIERGKKFSDYKYYEEGNFLYYANAAAGEVGEMCNMVKKYLRTGDDFNRGEKITPYDIALECADVIIYLEFITSIFGLSLSEILRTKFNDVSTKVNSDLFITKS